MTFDSSRSDAIRAGLVETVTPPRLRPATRRWLAGAALLFSGLLVGGAVSAAAVIATRPVMIAGTDTPAPPGVLPGEPIISLLGGVTTVSASGSLVIPLPTVPPGATHVRATLSCVTAGMVSWGIDPDGNNPSTGCDGPTEAGTAGWLDFALDETTTEFFVTADDGVESVITLQFVNYVETDWGINARGESFGISKDGQPDPDLLAAWITTSDGTLEIGYVRAADLEEFSPDHPTQPSNPTEATAWQTERDEKFPNGWDIPAYDSDGTTRIGSFHIGG